MQRLRAALVLATLLFAGLLASPAPTLGAGSCAEGAQASGAVYRICMPDAWNGKLLVYAHGFVDPARPVAIPEDHLELPDGTNLADVVTGLGFAFAMSSYSKNGLAVQEGLADSVDLVRIFGDLHGLPRRIYLVGVSEGGLVATLGVERRPDLFDGGIAACGPIGGFRNQIDYFGDVRVLFDHYFPGVIPGQPMHIPTGAIDRWDRVGESRVRDALRENPAARDEIAAVARIPVDPAGPTAAEDAIVGLLWYNVHATNDAVESLGGVPYDNTGQTYSGSSDDAELNRRIRRVSADPAALEAMLAYETTGVLESPLVVMHTTGDEIVPFQHVFAYGVRVAAAGFLERVAFLPVDRFGHCAFRAEEALLALAVLELKVLAGG